MAILLSGAGLKTSFDQFASFSAKLVIGFQHGQEPRRETRSKRFAHERPARVSSTMELYDRLNRDPNLCELLSAEELTMPGDVLNDVDIQFESQARLALTLAHFLSSFYQIINPAEDFPLRKAELELTDEQLIGEVLAAAGGDYKVVGVGIFFDRGKFRNHHLPYFGPYAYRPEKDISRKYTVVDWAGLSQGYENELWFRVMTRNHSASMSSSIELFSDAEISMGHLFWSISTDGVLAQIIHSIRLFW